VWSTVLGTNLCVWIQICICQMHACILIYECMHACMYACIGARIHTHTHTHCRSILKHMKQNLT
jgi:hypothetical protein